MRSKMNWLSIVFCLLAVAVVTQSASANVNYVNDPNEPGSVLVFPLYETGLAASNGYATVPPYAPALSTFEISVVCPNGYSCPDGSPQSDVDIKMHWVCPTSIGEFAPTQCSERDFTLNTTVNGTLIFDANGKCSPQGNISGTDTYCGSIPPPPCKRGYLIAWVVNESGQAIKFDGLLGDAVLRQDGLISAVAAYNAIPIQAGAALATGACVNRTCGNSVLNFNGVSYKELSNTIIGSVRFDNDAPDPVTGINYVTELVLLTLDIKSNQPNPLIEVGLDFSNEIESTVSTNTYFYCTAEVRLEGDLGINTAYMNGYKGLLTGSAQAVNPFTLQGLGPVTLVGLVITHEDSYSREYAYPLLDNSIGTATQFAP